jgi:hypothetical protein
MDTKLNKIIVLNHRLLFETPFSFFLKYLMNAQYMVSS